MDSTLDTAIAETVYNRNSVEQTLHSTDIAFRRQNCQQTQQSANTAFRRRSIQQTTAFVGNNFQLTLYLGGGMSAGTSCSKRTSEDTAYVSCGKACSELPDSLRDSFTKVGSSGEKKTRMKSLVRRKVS